MKLTDNQITRKTWYKLSEYLPPTSSKVIVSDGIEWKEFIAYDEMERAFNHPVCWMIPSLPIAEIFN